MKAIRFLGATALAGAAFALPGFAAAQTAPTAEQCADNPQLAGCATNADGTESTGGTIVVTGSRIARPTLSSPLPVTSVDASQLLASGNVSVGDALNDLPALRSTYTQANSNRFIGTSGLNLLDLRGLGISRTLVLVNGKRHITALPGDYIVDTNTIPADLLERVDVVTGGSSAVYGSDAVAGVVNFVLKRNFDGLRFRGQGSVTERGDHGSYFGSLTAGRNFADGRGNIAIALEYARANPLYFTDRDDLTGAFSGRSQFNLQSNTGLDVNFGSDGILDNGFYTGVRNGTISDGGLVTAVCPTTVAAGTVLAGRCRASRVIGATANNNERYSFDPNGNLVLSVPSLDFRDITNGGSTNTVGGLGSTLRNTGQLAPGLDRYSANLLFHYDVSDAFKPFVEAKYVRIDSLQEGQPSFFQGGALGTFSCSNPFLTAQALTTLQSIGRCATPAATFAVSRFNTDFGGRGEKNRRETYRVVAGVTGTFNDDWSYEFSVNYGELKTHLDSLNNLQLFNIDGSNGPFLKAIDAVRNAAGQIVCRVNQTTVTDPNCVPINLFGVGAPSAAALRYVNTTGTRDERATELDIIASLTGDLSQLFELPGGAVGFSIGGEYRRETAYSAYDPLTASGATFLNSIAPFTPPALTVKEAFGEINIPLLKDMPFAQELSISAAGRVSEYNTKAGSTFAYNVSGIYAPISDIKFRVGYSKSIRTPTQSDLYTAAFQNFASISDPCDVAFINNGNAANRARNCAAAGVPVGFVNAPARSQTLSIQGGGNPNLFAETSYSFTAGVVLQPRMLPGLTATIDFFDIKVKNLIATPSANAYLNNCYDAADLNNQFCARITRVAGGNFADPAVIVNPVNFASQKSRGIDFDIAYNHKFDNGDRLDYRIIATLVLDRTNFTNLNDPRVPDRILSELGDPIWSMGATVNYKHGPIGLRYTVNFVGPQTIGAFEAQNNYYELCPASGTNSLGACTANTIALRGPNNADQYSQVYYDAVMYHSIRAEIEATKKFTFYLGVDNLTNRLPPLGLLGTGAGDGIFSAYGRTYYAGVKFDM